MAIRLEHRPDLGRSQFSDVKELDPLQWADESFSAAVKDVYLSGKLETSPDEKEGPVLPEGYLSTAKLTAEKRMVLAGYRLAAFLMSIDGKPPGHDDIAVAKHANGIDAAEKEDPMDHESADQAPTKSEPTESKQAGKELLTPTTPGETIVLVTKSGKKYHMEGCGSLSTSDLSITLAEAREKGLEPCSKCYPPK